MNTGWHECRIGEILQLEYGKPLDGLDRKPTGRFPVYGANGEKDRTDKCYHAKASIIVGRKGSAGEINLVESNFWPLDVTYFVTFDERQHDLRFLYYLLTTLELTKLAKGVKPGINRNDVYAKAAKVPPLHEQQRIVAVLDEAFEDITTAEANTEKNLQNARAIFKSQLQSVFSQRGSGWISRTLGEIADFKNGLNFTRRSKGQTLRIVGVGDFQDCSVVPIESLQSVTIDGEIGDDYLIRPGDLLTVRSNGSKHLVGRCMLVPEVSEPTSFSGFIIRLRVDEQQISPEFLLKFMQSGDTRDRLNRDGGGSNISNINQAKLATLPITVPPRQEQERIAVRLDALQKQCDGLVAIYQRKLAALDALKTSLLNRAFAGELTADRTLELIEAVA